jgi:lysophospholipase L1-like esterase
MLGTGPWSQANMRAWDRTLLAACAKYPNMRVYDWAAAVKPAWFLPDGIHYTSAGYAARAAAIAGALARAFPAHGHSHGCGLMTPVRGTVIPARC